MNKYFIFTLFIIFFIGEVVGENILTPHVEITVSTSLQLEQGLDEYFFKFANFPKNQNITALYRKPISKNGLEYNKLDELIIYDNDLIEFNGVKNKRCLYYGINSSDFDFVLGEEVHYRFQLDDGTLVAETSFVPRPNRIQSKKGSFSMEAILQIFKPTNYFFRFNGLEENEIIHMEFISGEESLKHDIEYHSQLGVGFIPDIIGKLGGKSKIKFSRKSKDYVVFELDWGLEIINHYLNESISNK